MYECRVACRVLFVGAVCACTDEAGVVFLCCVLEGSGVVFPVRHGPYVCVRVSLSLFHALSSGSPAEPELTTSSENLSGVARDESLVFVSVHCQCVYPRA